MRDQPLVSCLMATYNRRAFLPMAIECWRRQTYQRRELLILDDSESSNADLIPSDPDIRYIWRKDRTAVGHKWNQLAREARGDLLAFWADDDWHAPDRLKRQVQKLLTGVAADACCVAPLRYLDLTTGQTWLYDVVRPIDTTLVFTRAYFELGEFGPSGEEFMIGKPAPLILHDPSLYIATRHGSNTWSGFFREPGAWRPVEFDVPLELAQFVNRPDIVRGIDAEARTALRDLATRLESGQATVEVHQLWPTQHYLTFPDRVSCLMLTYNRPRFAAMAVQCWQAQTYPDRELVIVDDGQVPYTPPDDPRIRYFRVNHKLLVGVKWNLAAQAASGSLLAFWADDDWHHPERLETQVAALRAFKAEACALHGAAYIDFATGKRWRCTETLDGTYLFTRHYYDLAPFPRADAAEAAVFVHTRSKPAAHVILAGDLYLGVVHGHNLMGARFEDNPLWHEDHNPRELPLEVAMLARAKEKLVMEHVLSVVIEAFTGEDLRLYSRAMEDGSEDALTTFARHCMAKCREPGRPLAGQDPARQDLIVQLPYGAFRLVDATGNVERCDARAAGGLVIA